VSALILPRRLAIALLAEAQKSGDAVSGVITARDGVPASVRPGAASTEGEDIWARYRSGAAHPDAAPGRQLLISLDTKGVLQLRCWEGAVERELRII
jgi:hypothetical protein